jgi:hypothetical protein
MRLSLALIAAASIISLTQVASAAEQKGQGCDLKGVKGSGCEPPGGPGGKVLPAQEKSGPTKGGPGPTNPPPPPPGKEK